MLANTSFNVIDAVALLPDWAQSRRRSAFCFDVDFITGAASAIPANAAVSGDIKIGDDADFVWVYSSAVLTNDAAQAVFVATLPLTAQITDGGSGRFYMNQPLPIGGVFGAIGAAGAVGPFVLPQPAILARSSTITLTLSNLTATATFSARCQFWGFKMYGDPLPAGV
jgi:nitrate/nitrite transporter NarK